MVKHHNQSSTGDHHYLIRMFNFDRRPFGYLRARRSMN